MNIHANRAIQTGLAVGLGVQVLQLVGRRLGLERYLPRGVGSYFVSAGCGLLASRVVYSLAKPAGPFPEWPKPRLEVGSIAVFGEHAGRIGMHRNRSVTEKLRKFDGTEFGEWSRDDIYLLCWRHGSPAQEMRIPASLFQGKSSSDIPELQYEGVPMQLTIEQGLEAAVAYARQHAAKALWPRDLPDELEEASVYRLSQGESRPVEPSAEVSRLFREEKATGAWMPEKIVVKERSKELDLTLKLPEGVMGVDLVIAERRLMLITVASEERLHYQIGNLRFDPRTLTLKSTVSDGLLELSLGKEG